MGADKRLSLSPSNTGAICPVHDWGLALILRWREPAGLALTRRQEDVARLPGLTLVTVAGKLLAARMFCRVTLPIG